MSNHKIFGWGWRADRFVIMGEDVTYAHVLPTKCSAFVASGGTRGET
jgi:hypothetical protein